MQKNLWGNLPNVENMRTPNAILLEQASMLGELTNGLLNGQVKRLQDGPGFKLSFKIVAPALNNYSYLVLTVTHPIQLYPLKLFNETKFMSSKDCESEFDFENALREILTSPEVHRVIAGLLAQIRADEKEAPSESTQ